MSHRAESMFRDEAVLRCTAGKGGAGCSSMHREKYVNMGGPDGGDGGDGGSILLVADAQENSLFRLSRHVHVEAEDGQPGEGNNRTGRRGKSEVLVVPVGTLIRDAKHGNVLADLDQDGVKLEVAIGGKGGRGNARFTSATNQAPTHSERGKLGEEREIQLELKLVAEVGLVGLPNAGKSTMLSVLTAARPRVGAYPFTTLDPSLGILPSGRSGRDVVLADIPGLIEGAADGKGLGHRFLRHVERTQMLLHLVDCSADSENPISDYDTIRAELAAYSEELASRPSLVLATKIEDEVTEERADALLAHVGAGLKVSAAASIGLDELRARLLERRWALQD